MTASDQVRRLGLPAASLSLCSHCQGTIQRTEDHRSLLLGPLPWQRRWYGAQVALQRSPILRSSKGIVPFCQVAIDELCFARSVKESRKEVSGHFH